MRTAGTLALWGAVLLALFGVGAACADIVTLRDGSRYYGEILSESSTEIEFRIHQASGAIATRVFPRALMRSAERNGMLIDPLAEETAPASKSGHVAEDDFDQMLREAWELLDDHESAAALRALQKLVTRAPQEKLAKFEAAHRAQRGISLDDQMAELRLNQALATSPPGALRLKYATPFEAAALGRRLSALHDALVARQYADASVQWWADNSGAYTELRRDARHMVDDATLAAGAIGARLRFDPTLRSDRAAASAVLAQRDALSRLAARVRELPGFSALRAADISIEDDPTLAEADRILERQHEAEAAAERELEQLNGDKPEAPTSSPSEPKPVDEEKP